MKANVVFTCFCFLFLGISCQSENNLDSLENQESPLPNKFIPITLSDSEQEIGLQSLDFSLRLFQETNQALEGAESQFVISPLSAFWALSMISEGANSTTLQEFKKVLGCEEFSQNTLHSYNQKLLTELKKVDNTCTLKVANSIWLNKDFEAKANYVEKMKDTYEVDLFSIDFQKNSSVATINDWCSQMTDGRITQIVKGFDPEACLLLLNAMYFKGGWKMNFDERNTEKGIFTNKDQSNAEIDFMKQTMAVDFAENDLFTLAELPYGNGAYSMVILLPNLGVDVNQCIDTLDMDFWMNNISEKREQMLNIELPKFKIEACITDLKDIVRNMGLQTAFTPMADFSSLSDMEVMLTKVNQSISFSVDEKGTEAAAITSIEAGGGLSDEKPEVKIQDFHVNRPFIFILMEQSTNSILFMGKIVAV